MAKLTVGQKAARALALLLGLRNPRVVEVLTAHGFSSDDLNEGWELLRKVTRTRLDASTAEVATDPALLEKLDAWENKWFPIASASLKRRFPDAYQWLFKNLAQTEGTAVILSVQTFVDRVELLTKPKKDDGFGPGGKEARKLLEVRGINDACVKEAKGLLESLGAIATPKADQKAGEEDSAKFAAAEANLWAWYLEWGTIARTSIKDRKILRQLGFLKGGSSRSSSDEEALDDTAEASDEEAPEGAPEEAPEATEEATPAGKAKAAKKGNS